MSLAWWNRGWSTLWIWPEANCRTWGEEHLLAERFDMQVFEAETIWLQILLQTSCRLPWALYWLTINDISLDVTKMFDVGNVNAISVEACASQLFNRGSYVTHEGEQIKWVGVYMDAVETRGLKGALYDRSLHKELHLRGHIRCMQCAPFTL